MQLSIFASARVGNSSYYKWGNILITISYISSESCIYNHSGDNGVEDPPVPIPNTEVKLYCADGTYALRVGRVGRCRISKNRTIAKSAVVLFFVLRESMFQVVMCGYIRRRA